MSLVVDNRATLTGPATHILIASVGAYPHDPELGPLANATSSAAALRRWIEDHQDGLAHPLGTMRYLASPASELGAELARCTLANFVKACGEWRLDASTHPDNVTWLYLSGRGLTAGFGEQAFALEDFGEPFGPKLRGAVAVNNIVSGMGASHERPAAPRRQYYFIDLAQHQSRIPDLLWQNATAVFDVTLPSGGTQSTLYSARGLSEAAPGPATRPLTAFCDALLRGLDGAGTATLQPDGQWAVTADSLARGLMGMLGPDVTVSGAFSSDVLATLRAAPKVRVDVEVEAFDGAELELRDSANAVIAIMTMQGHSVVFDVDPGIYAVDVRAPGQVGEPSRRQAFLAAAHSDQIRLKL